MIEDLKSNCSGDFLKALIGLVQDRDEYDCVTIYNACKGWGTNEAAVTEILCTRTHPEITAIKRVCTDRRAQTDRREQMQNALACAHLQDLHTYLR